MKNPPKTGHSGRRGNAVSPYCKFGKVPAVYEPYATWREKHAKRVAAARRANRNRFYYL